MKSIELTAVVVASTLLVGGTYAWSAFSQKATNEMVEGSRDAGGRLHDDFNGSNKDVYVENYTAAGAGDEIYARVRIREYFEYGDLAGDITGSSSAEMKLLRGDKQVTSTPSITDETTWDIYLYGSTPTQGIDTIRTYRDLEFGGSTIYMPTFNQDNTNLRADINGTLEGALGLGRTDVMESYTDYKTYGLGDTKDDLVTTADDITGTLATHTAKETLDSTIMTMDDWLLGGGKNGDYWVYDEDGWAYWANPIEAGTATGLLLDSVKVVAETDERWYYGVEVEAEIATAGDWGDDSLDTGMYGDITSDGLGLLNKVSGLLKVSSLIVTNNGATIPNTTFNLAYVESLNLIPEVTVEYGTGASYETEVEWSITEISENSGVTLDSSIFNNGIFNPTEDMIGSTYEITVTSKLTPSRTITYTITVMDIPEAIEIATEDDVVDVRNTENLQLYAYEENTTNPVSVTWSIVEASGNSGLTQEQINACLDENGVFTPDASMAGCTYTVIATTPYGSVAPATKVISVYDDSSASVTVNAAGNVSSMTLSPTNYTLQITATVTGLLDKSVAWVVTDNNGTSGMSQNSLNACIDEKGLFSPTDAMAGGSYTITATSKVDGSFYDSVTISITVPTITIYTLDNTDDLDNGDEIQYQAIVSGLIDTSIIWSLDSTEKGNIDSDGKLTLSSTASIAGGIDIIASLQSNTNISGELRLVLGYRIPGSTYEDLEEIVGTTTTVKSRGEDGNDIEYYVLDAKKITEYSESGVNLGDSEAVLLWAIDGVTISGDTTHAFDLTNSNQWENSLVRNTTLKTWELEQINLLSKAVRVLVSTDGYYPTYNATVGNGSITTMTTYDKTFLLSQDEFYQYLGLLDSRVSCSGDYWLRSPADVSTAVFMDIALSYYSEYRPSRSGVHGKYLIRPALWVVP